MDIRSGIIPMFDQTGCSISNENKINFVNLKKNKQTNNRLFSAWTERVTICQGMFLEQSTLSTFSGLYWSSVRMISVKCTCRVWFIYMAFRTSLNTFHHAFERYHRHNSRNTVVKCVSSVSGFCRCRHTQKIPKPEKKY